MPESKKFHYDVSARKSGAAEIHIYGYIGPWEEVDYKGFQAAFRELLENNKNITVRIHSGGGSVLEGLAIYDLMRSSNSNIKVVVEGMAASMASVIALGGDEIQMTENAFFMIHAPSGGAYGQKETLESAIKQMEICEDRIVKIYKERTGAADELIAGWMKQGQNTWLPSDECLEVHLCDKVVKPTKNRKNINPKNKSMEAIFASYEGEAPIVKTHGGAPQHKPKNEKMKLKLLALLGAFAIQHSLTAESNESEFEAVLKDALEKGKEADDLKAELKKIRMENAEALVNAAQKAGKFPASEKEEWLQNAMENFSLTSKALERMPGKPDINALLDRDPKNPTPNEDEILNGREDWNLEKWQKEDPKGLESLEEKAPNAFEKLFNDKYSK